MNGSGSDLAVLDADDLDRQLRNGWLMECEVAEAGCQGKTRARCFACGMAACPNCSLLSIYYRYGRRRVCFTCLAQHYDNASEVIEARSRRENGEVVTMPRLRHQVHPPRLVPSA